MNSACATPRRARQLRDLLESNRLEFLMEAHNGLSARIVQEAGFAGVWASGLALSAAFGVRDSNEASWTQVLEAVEFMADATTLPILLDGDTGYGNFNNLRRLVTKLEQRGVAGVCIEDKLFPKTNSFIDGERQTLADVDEFCGKIRAGKDAQRDPDFCIVARVEALIAGWSVDEALERAQAYHAAGADAILIHDKAPRFDNIQAFAAAWGDRCPLVIVPTKYYSTPTDVFRAAGISVAIWANHSVRSAVTAMQRTAREVFENQSVAGIEDRIAPVSELFRLQGDDELRAAERRYTGGETPIHAVVLAAARGEGLESVTQTCPKAMLEIGGKPLLRRLVDVFKQRAIHEVTVVAGYRAEAIDVPGVRVVENPDFAQTGELASLGHARAHFGDDNILLYGDLVFRRHVLADLLDAPGEIVVVVDSDAATSANGHPLRDPAWCSAPDDRSLFAQRVTLTHVGAAGAPKTAPCGRWIGLMRIRGAGRARIAEAIDTLQAEGRYAQAGIPDLLNSLVAAGARVEVVYIAGHWLDVNDLDDLRAAGDFAHGGTP